jgi:phosphoribosylglycinamide formyltransferase-1
MSGPLRIGALLSGGGRTLLNIQDAIDEGRLDAEVVVVITSRASAAGVERARARGLDVRVATTHALGSVEAVDDAITRWLLDAGVQLVCLCGYLRLLRIDEALKGRVMNIHPALLPDYGGRGMFGDHVHRAVLEAGDTVSGCTVHFVDEVYDHGPTILQRRCPVEPDDTPGTLAARVFEQECVAYPEAIRLFAEERLRLVDGRVVIEGHPPS